MLHFNEAHAGSTVGAVEILTLLVNGSPPPPHTHTPIRRFGSLNGWILFGRHFAGGGGSYKSSAAISSSWVEAGNTRQDGYVELRLLSGDTSDVQEWRMGTCGQTGYQGPTSTQCTSTYQSTDPWNMYQQVTTQGVQRVRWARTCCTARFQHHACSFL